MFVAVHNNDGDALYCFVFLASFGCQNCEARWLSFNTQLRYFIHYKDALNLCVIPFFYRDPFRKFVTWLCIISSRMISLLHLGWQSKQAFVFFPVEFCDSIVRFVFKIWISWFSWYLHCEWRPIIVEQHMEVTDVFSTLTRSV